MFSVGVSVSVLIAIVKVLTILIEAFVEDGEDRNKRKNQEPLKASFQKPSVSIAEQNTLRLPLR